MVKSVSGGPLGGPDFGSNRFGIPSEKAAPVIGLVTAIDQTPEGGMMKVTKDVKDAAQSIGDILRPPGEGSS